MTRARRLSEMCDFVDCGAAGFVEDRAAGLYWAYMLPDMGCSRALGHEGGHLRTRFLGHCDPRFKDPVGRRGHLDAHKHFFFHRNSEGPTRNFVSCKGCNATLTWGFRATPDGGLVRFDEGHR